MTTLYNIKKGTVFRTFGGQVYIVVRISESSAKIIVDEREEWKDDSIIFSDLKPGHHISAGTQVDENRYLALIPHRIESRAAAAATLSKPTDSHVYVPRPGTIPKQPKRRTTNVPVTPELVPSEPSLAELLQKSAQAASFFLL